MKTKESQLGQVSLRFIRSIAVNRAQTKHSARNRRLANSHAGMATRLPPTWKLARPLNTRAFVGTNPIGRVDNFRVAGQSGVIRRSDARYALDAKAAIFRRARRLLPALAAILIPASVLSKKSAMLSRSASERISLWFFALVSTRISA